MKSFELLYSKDNFFHDIMNALILIQLQDMKNNEHISIMIIDCDYIIETTEKDYETSELRLLILTNY